MSGRFLVYFADPMCAWCYAFGPELEALVAARPLLRVDVVMGGLRAYDTQAATPALRESVAGHWEDVARETGVRFGDAALAREGFVYDTEPACRAVAAAREADPARALPYLKRVQLAFHAHGRDVTRPEELADLAAQEGFDAPAFLATLESAAAREAVRRDFEATQRTGVTGLPTLAVAYPGNRYFLVTAGFARVADLLERLDRIDEVAGIA